MDPRIEELLREARKAAKVDRERIELFQGMIKTPAWTVYVELLEAKLQMLADRVLSPASGIDALVALEYLKGTMSGLVIARDIPAVTIAGKELLRESVKEDDDDDESV